MLPCSPESLSTVYRTSLTKIGGIMRDTRGEYAGYQAKQGENMNSKFELCGTECLEHSLTAHNRRHSSPTADTIRAYSPDRQAFSASSVTAVLGCR
jgi:hypothetical protein